MNVWLRCSLEKGMLPREYAVELDTSDVGRISLFAPEDKVNPDKGLMTVEMLQESNGSVVVLLPASPFEITSRSVKVPRNSVVIE